MWITDLARLIIRILIFYLRLTSPSNTSSLQTANYVSLALTGAILTLGILRELHEETEQESSFLTGKILTRLPSFSPTRKKEEEGELGVVNDQSLTDNNYGYSKILYLFLIITTEQINVAYSKRINNPDFAFAYSSRINLLIIFNAITEVTSIFFPRSKRCFNF